MQCFRNTKSLGNYVKWERYSASNVDVGQAEIILIWPGLQKQRKQPNYFLFSCLSKEYLNSWLLIR